MAQADVPRESPADEPDLPSGLAALVERAGEPAAARPVENWNPPSCGAIDMRIAADGTWFYRGSPIRREPLVRLFASILRREPDGSFVLVTPVEKLTIDVEDAPFLAVEMEAEGAGSAAILTFRTNTGDVIAAGPEHRLRVAIDPATEGLKPYVEVRRGLEALAARSVALAIAERAEAGEGGFGIWSGGAFFAFPEAALG